ncbi:MAG TPA: ATP-binding protein, partial [Candidatus Saccharibacteria bacterium]|nr:ATP-binding protein [Candidatus Saccharibacteria bacterium]
MNNDIPDSQYVADALWLDEFDLDKIPKNIQDKIQSEKHSTEAYGDRMREYLKLLTQKQQSHNPNYKKRYRELSKHIDELTPHQAYTIIARFLGNNTTQFFDQIPSKVNLQFPRDHQPKLTSQVGWHFFVGSVWAEDGQEYGIELMFFRQSILPPKLAKEFGLTDVENQVIEI